MSNEPARVQRGDVVPVHARHDQVVEIHWRMPDGRIVKEKHENPEKVVTTAEESES